MAEKTIRTCDHCATERRVTEAVDRVRLVSTSTRRSAVIDLCDEHADALFRTSSTRARRMGRRSESQSRRTDRMLRCPLPGDDGYEGPGQGMFQHFRHAHEGTTYDDEAKAAGLAAYEAAHGSKGGRRRRAA